MARRPDRPRHHTTRQRRAAAQAGDERQREDLLRRTPAHGPGDAADRPLRARGVLVVVVSHDLTAAVHVQRRPRHSGD